LFLFLGLSMTTPPPIAAEIPCAPTTSTVLDEQLLTDADLARLLRVTPRTIQRHAATGRLPRPIRIGSSNRWLPSQIRALLAGEIVA
jgi:predicted DNA-binding transcriptional regulator AlpA